METMQQILSFCGAVSIIGGAAGVIYKMINPAFKFSNRMKSVEDNLHKDYERFQSLEDKMNAIEKMQNSQSKCLVAMLNHQLTGNGIDEMKKIRDELLESVIENN